MYTKMAEGALLLTITLILVGYGSCTVFYQPEQIHLSYGVNPSVMVVTWSTMNSTNSSIVQYGVGKLQMTASGYITKFVDGGPLKHTQYIHRVKINGLQPGQTYLYNCGSRLGWSELFYFKAMPNDSSWSPRIAFFGDMGNINAQSVPRLQNEVEDGLYDAIFHVGDFAYDMDSNNAQVGDEFMRQIEPIAAYVPYMTCPGNHETKYNFSNYKNRFSMPFDETGENMFYSFNIGPAHVISISTEYYFALYYGVIQVVKQYEWVERDLKEANKPENRKLRPWIITMGHRPMYCSNSDNDDCTHRESLVRIGVPYIHLLGLEKLFYDYGVDLALWAHEHSYERLWPVFNRKVYNGSLSQPYTNPKAPVHIITGSAGCQERHDKFHNETMPWSAFRNLDYGYTRMQIMNSSHLYLEQVSDDKGGQVVDKLTIIKDKHGPY